VDQGGGHGGLGADGENKFALKGKRTNETSPKKKKIAPRPKTRHILYEGKQRHFRKPEARRGNTKKRGTQRRLTKKKKKKPGASTAFEEKPALHLRKGEKQKESNRRHWEREKGNVGAQSLKKKVHTSQRPKGCDLDQPKREKGAVEKTGECKYKNGGVKSDLYSDGKGGRRSGIEKGQFFI